MSSIIDKITGKADRKHALRPVAVITPLGKTTLEKPGIPEYQYLVLNHLNENGPCNVDDLASELSMSLPRVKSICSDMRRDGFIEQRTGGQAD